MKIRNYKDFFENKEVIFVDDNKEKLSQYELDLIADIIKYFDSEAEIKGEPGWEDVEGYVKCVKPDEIHIGVKYDFHHLDGEVQRNSEVVIIDRKTGKWTHQPEEINEGIFGNKISVEEHREGLIEMYETFLQDAKDSNLPFKTIVFTEALRKLKESDIDPKNIEKWVVRLEKAWRTIPGDSKFF